MRASASTTKEKLREALSMYGRCPPPASRRSNYSPSIDCLSEPHALFDTLHPPPTDDRHDYAYGQIIPLDFTLRANSPAPPFSPRYTGIDQVRTAPHQRRRNKSLTPTGGDREVYAEIGSTKSQTRLSADQFSHDPAVWKISDQSIHPARAFEPGRKSLVYGHTRNDLLLAARSVDPQPPSDNPEADGDLVGTYALREREAYDTIAESVHPWDRLITPNLSKVNSQPHSLKECSVDPSLGRSPPVSLFAQPFYPDPEIPYRRSLNAKARFNTTEEDQEVLASYALSAYDSTTHELPNHGDHLGLVALETDKFGISFDEWNSLWQRRRSPLR
ncbi:MAG: hypothetical protein TREMPRED_005777 [Tremellales sp. Tagirdzhanova-0007]|nr:MAG: hypothetical protein TREMPRED_005777 [Tremellales sp. Tagirdzhanova-0007]